MPVRSVLSTKSSRYLIIILAAATAVTALSTILTYRNAIQSAEDSLKLQALGIAVSLEPLLPKMSSGEGNIFREIITEGVWEGIAFIALYEQNGLTLLHSNEKLIGKRVEDRSIQTVSRTGQPLYGYTTLGTGEQVFVLNFPVHFENTGRILRLALRTYTVENAERQAKFQMASIAVLIAILWITGFFFKKAVDRSENLKREMAEKERLTVLGEMSSVLAHEIRNPLGSIKGFAQYLLEQISEEAGQGRSQSLIDHLTIIVSESERLEALTEDLLVYARPVEVRPQEFDLRELIFEIVQALRQSHGEGVEVRTSVPDITVTSDRDKMKQIVTNVLQNSLDALDPGGAVEIKAATRNGRVALTVSDNGCGMDVETKEKAFKPFFTTKTRGTGLGLAIVGKLTEALKGRVELQSEPQRGTTFTVEIPKNLSTG